MFKHGNEAIGMLDAIERTKEKQRIAKLENINEKTVINS